MKKFFIALIGAVLLTGCGAGSYSVASGKADEGMLSFVSADKTPITVRVDGNSYDMFTVKTKAWRKDRNIKATALNTIYLAPGQHDITVVIDGQEVHQQKIFVSAQEHKVIEL
jgi:archaellum component FlaG (FlaF/FlaG flagellin family)